MYIKVLGPTNSVSNENVSILVSGFIKVKESLIQIIIIHVDEYMGTIGL